MIAETLAGVKLPYTGVPFTALPPPMTIFAPKYVIKSEAAYMANIMSGELSAMIFSAFVKSSRTSPAAFSNFFCS